MKNHGREPSIAAKCLNKLVSEGTLGKNDSILTICAANFEHKLFQEVGFTDVTISNLDPRLKGDEYAPFKWSFQDAEELKYPDGSFDWCYVHAGLHHCHSPHRGLLEMYRVARKGVIVMESRDSLAMRTAIALKLVGSYELEAVVRNGFEYGGVSNTPVPNYVYRWTEREFLKTIQSYNPTGKHTYRFFHGLRLPFVFAQMYKNPLKTWALYAIKPLFTAFAAVFPKQMNHFAMVAIKPRDPQDLWPWIEKKDGKMRLSREYADKVFHNMKK